jgi:hypothetical protein
MANQSKEEKMASKSRNKGLTLHPLSVNQIASAMLATPPIKKKKRAKN